MNTLLIFAWIWAAMLANSFWESAVEGRVAGDNGKIGWKFKLLGMTMTKYHFFLFFVMYPLLLTLPFVIYGWNERLFGVLVSAYVSGMIVEDFGWYVVNPVVK
ncbi:MAG: hypothetical protein KGI49_01515, partial [Patescibacteria group bacterium]|nr:hypothetical protein [Patescibacteria group bacterium]